jgi:DNA-binding beta-propeller fold protein YncE
VRSSVLIAIISMSASALAQTPMALPPAAGGAGRNATPGALRPPNIPNPRGTDSGAGPACDQLTAYGQVQPAGPAATGYGAASPTPGPGIAMPTYAAPVAPRPDSTLGAGGMATRGTVVPNVPVLPYRYVPAPQPPRGTPAFANVNSVGLLKNGRVIVNQRMPMYQVLEYTPDNRLMRNLNPNMVSRPHGMRIDAQDNIWLTDQQCHVVIKMNASGDVLQVLGTPGQAGAWDEAKGQHLFNQPTDLAFAPNGDVFVSVGHGAADPMVVRFDRNGRYVTSWSMKHASPTQVVIHTIAVNARTNEIYVGDREINTIRVFDANGKPLREIKMTNLICGLYVDAKNQLWMTTGMDGMVLKLDWNGKILGRIGQSGFGANDFGDIVM